MLSKVYNKMRFWISKKEEKGEASSGFLPPRVRNRAVSLININKGKLLEIGCGEGLFITMVAKKLSGVEIMGIEASEDVMEAASRRAKSLGLSNTRFMTGRAEGMDFENSTFDKVVCLNMLYNLKSRENVEKVINEMARVCRQEGSIIFDIRNKSNPVVRLVYKKVKSYDPACPWPLHAYTLKEIKDILKKYNLKVKNAVPVVSVFGILPLTYVIEAEKC